MSKHDLTVVDGDAIAHPPDRQPMTLASWEGTVRGLTPGEEEDVAE